MGALTSFRTVSDASVVAAGMIAAGERLSQVWRHAVVQMMDDYDSARRHHGVETAAAMWRDEPTATGDLRVDAGLAAMAEHLARRDGWPVPAWARDSSREAVPWWFVTDLKGMHPRALVESPASFRRRGVFITRGALDRA